jgi:hypothetical protein
MRFAAIGVAILVSSAAFAQSPYAGLQTRSIKALSEEQIADLKAGRGMGLALPAELNGYPGPAHLLELSDKLELSADQRARIKQLFDAMKAEAFFAYRSQADRSGSRAGSRICDAFHHARTPSGCDG